MTLSLTTLKKLNPVVAGTAVPAGTTVPSAQISDASSVGVALLKAADAPAQRTALGLGTAATQASTAFDPAGAATGALATHVAAVNPHTQYLTQSQADLLYNPLGSGGAVTVASISNASQAGKDLLLAVDVAAQRNKLALGTAALSSTTDFVSAATGTSLANADIASGQLTGNNLVLTKVGGGTITIDVTATLADLRVTSGVYNATTKALDFTLSDSSKISVPVSALLPVTVGSSLTGDGATTALAVAYSADSGNTARAGTDGKVFASPTNITATASPTGVAIASSTGSSGALPLATAVNAGALSPAQFSKISDLPTNIVQSVNSRTPDGAGNVNTRTFTAGAVGATAVVLNLADYLLVGAPHQLVISPEAGCTIQIEFSTNSGSTYSTYESATVSTVYQYILQPGDTAVTHIRLTRTVGTGVTTTYALSGGIDFAQYPAGTPVGSVSSESITDASPIGKQVLTATDAAQARTYLGISGTGTSTVAGITDAGATGKAVLSSETQATARTNLGLGSIATLNASTVVQTVNGRTPDVNGDVLTKTFTAGTVGVSPVTLSLATYLLVGAPHTLIITPDTGCSILVQTSTDGTNFTTVDTYTQSDALRYTVEPGETAITHIKLSRTIGSSVNSTYSLSGSVDYAQYPAGTTVGGNGTTTIADITDATALGKQLLGATTQALAQGYLGLGTAATKNASTIVQTVNSRTPDGSGNLDTRSFTSGTVGGTAVILTLATYYLSGAPHTLSVVPDTGCTIQIDYSTDGGSTYSNVASATSSEVFQYLLQPNETAATHIKLTRPSGTSIASTYALSGGVDYAQYPAGTTISTISSNGITDATGLGKQLLTAGSQTLAQGYLGLGSAALQSTSSFATAAQGSKADAAIPSSAIGTTVAGLTAGKLDPNNLPDLAIADYLGSVASQTAMLTLTGQKGDWCIRTDLGTTWIITGNTPSVIGSWTQLSYPVAPVTSVAGKTGAVVLSTADISGIGAYGSSFVALTTRQDALNNLAGAATSGYVMRGNGTNVVMGAIQAADVPTLNQNTTGSAATLTTARNISITGDATWTVSFNGGANVSAALTLANSGVTAGTYSAPSIDVDAKGRITGITSQSVVKSVNNATPDGSGNVNTVQSTSGTIGASLVVVALATYSLSGLPHVLTISPDSGCTITVEYSTNGGSTYTTFTTTSLPSVYQYTVAANETAVTHVRLSRTGGSALNSNYSISGGTNLVQYPSNATTYLSPSTNVTQTVLGNATSYGAGLLTKANNAALNITASDLSGLPTHVSSLLTSTSTALAQSALGLTTTLTANNYFFIGTYADTTTLEAAWPAASWNGFYALVGAAPSTSGGTGRTAYKSNGTAWVTTGVNAIANTSLIQGAYQDAYITFALTTPSYIQSTGGYIYIDGAGGGGGGSGGFATASTAGGGGGGGAKGCFMLPCYIPSGVTSINVRIGFGGVGGAIGAAGGNGTASSILIGSAFIINLAAGFGASAPSLSTSSGKGGDAGGYFYGGGAASSTTGTSGNPAIGVASAMDFLTQGRFISGASGGSGATSTGTGGGAGGNCISVWTSATIGASSGGGGGAGPWGRLNNLPIMAPVGTGGTGGLNGVAGTSALTDTFGAGGGGGGANAIGGNGGHGFLRIYF